MWRVTNQLYLIRTAEKIIIILSSMSSPSESYSKTTRSKSGKPKHDTSRVTTDSPGAAISMQLRNFKADDRKGKEKANKKKTSVKSTLSSALAGSGHGGTEKTKLTTRNASKKLKELGEVAALAKSGQGGEVKKKAKSGNATKVLVESASGTEETKSTPGYGSNKLKELGEVAALVESGQGGEVKKKAKSGNATEVLVESASGTEKTKPTSGYGSNKLKELGEVAALAESGTEKTKATSRNAGKKLKGKTLETAVATLADGTASVEKAQGGVSSSSNLSYEQQASVLVELCNLVVRTSSLVDNVSGEPFFRQFSREFFGPNIDHDDMEKLLIHFHESINAGVPPVNMISILEMQQSFWEKQKKPPKPTITALSKRLQEDKTFDATSYVTSFTSKENTTCSDGSASSASIDVKQNDPTTNITTATMPLDNETGKKNSMTSNLLLLVPMVLPPAPLLRRFSNQRCGRVKKYS